MGNTVTIQLVDEDIMILENLKRLDPKTTDRLKDLLLLAINAPMQYELAAQQLQAKVLKYKK